MCDMTRPVHRWNMNRYIIERNIAGAGRLSAEDLQKIARRSVEVLDSMDAAIQWNESFVTGDKLFCVYLAEGEDALREHGRRGGFPVDGGLRGDRGVRSHDCERLSCAMSCRAEGGAFRSS